VWTDSHGLLLFLPSHNCVIPVFIDFSTPGESESVNSRFGLLLVGLRGKKGEGVPESSSEYVYFREEHF
jgi:hypothetical protein